MELRELGGRGSRASGSIGALLVGVGIGAAIMWFMDPNRGARRRHMAVDRAQRLLRDKARQSREIAVDAKNRAIGAVAEARNARAEGDVDGDTLVARVRAELGHHVERSRNIEVAVENGCVILSGSASVDEIDRAERAVKGVRGVTGIDNQLVPSELAFDQGSAG